MDISQKDCRGSGRARRLRTAALCLLGLLSTGLAVARAAEDPRIRAQVAVDNGLKWLAAHQITEGPDAGSWNAPEPRYRSGVMAKYAALVSSASEGAVTRPAS